MKGHPLAYMDADTMLMPFRPVLALRLKDSGRSKGRVDGQRGRTVTGETGGRQPCIA